MILFHNGLHVRTAGAGNWRPTHYEGGGDSVELPPEDLHEAQAETWNQTESILLGYHLHRLLLSARPSEKISVSPVPACCLIDVYHEVETLCYQIFGNLNRITSDRYCGSV